MARRVSPCVAVACLLLLVGAHARDASAADGGGARMRRLAQAGGAGGDAGGGGGDGGSGKAHGGGHKHHHGRKHEAAAADGHGGHPGHSGHKHHKHDDMPVPQGAAARVPTRSGGKHRRTVPLEEWQDMGLYKGWPAGAAPTRDPVVLPSGYVPRFPNLTMLLLKGERPAGADAPFPSGWPPEPSRVHWNTFYTHTMENVCVGEEIIMFGVSSIDQTRIRAVWKSLLPKATHRNLRFYESMADMDKNRQREEVFYYLPGASFFAQRSLENILHTFHERLHRLAVNAVLGRHDFAAEGMDQVKFKVPGRVDHIVTDHHVIAPLSQFSGGILAAIANLLHKNINEDAGAFPYLWQTGADVFVCGDAAVVESSHDRALLTPPDFDPDTLLPRFFKPPRYIQRRVRHPKAGRAVPHPLGRRVMVELREMVYSLYGRTMPAPRDCWRKALVYDHANSFHNLVRNGAEISRLMADRGFDVLFYHDLFLSFDQTLDLFSQIDVFVLPAGGVVATVMLMPEKSGIIEMIGHGHWSWLDRFLLLDALAFYHTVIPGVHAGGDVPKSFCSLPAEHVQDALHYFSDPNDNFKDRPARVCSDKPGSIDVFGLAGKEAVNYVIE